MSFNAIRENKILKKISESTVLVHSELGLDLCLCLFQENDSTSSGLLLCEFTPHVILYCHFDLLSSHTSR